MTYKNKALRIKSKGSQINILYIFRIIMYSTWNSLAQFQNIVRLSRLLDKLRGIQKWMYRVFLTLLEIYLLLFVS